MKLGRIMIAPLLALALLGCANNQEGGTVVGAVAGGLIGNQFGSGTGRALATVAGVVAGGIIGSEIGRGLDEEERRAAMDAEYRALEYGDEPVRWRGRRDGYYGSVKPGRRYQSAGLRCREYEHDVWIGGRQEVVRGKACRQSDGTWKQA